MNSKFFSDFVLSCMASCFLALLTSCHDKKTDNIDLAKEPDYSDTTQWYTVKRGGTADFFYIVSTDTRDYTDAKGNVHHFADTYNDSTRDLMTPEIIGVEHLLCGDLNYFSPYYRQCTLESYLDWGVAQERMQASLNDVRKAFHHYIKYENGGRPFVLVGFSQGAMLAVELLKEMDDDAFSRMVATYAIGMSIDKETAKRTNRIVAAHDSADTGVLICYNSARDEAGIGDLFANSAFLINPVNWRTDTTPANVITVSSPLKPEEEQPVDTLIIRLDTTFRTLFVAGCSDDYITPLIGKEGNYHSREIWFYRTSLKENIALRTRIFLEKTKHQ